MRVFAITASAVPALVLILVLGYSLIAGSRSEAQELRSALVLPSLPVAAQIIGAAKSRVSLILLGGAVLGLSSGLLIGYEVQQVGGSTPSPGLILGSVVLVAELAIILLGIHLIRLRGQTKQASIAFTFLVALLVGAVALARMTSSEPKYEDPFSATMDAVFAEAGMPVVASGIGEFSYNYSGPEGESTRVLWIQVDESLCRGGDLDCMIDYLEQQSWVNSAFTQEEYPFNGDTPLGFKLEGDRSRCDGGMRPLLDAADAPTRLREAGLDSEPGLWFVRLACK